MATASSGKETEIKLRVDSAEDGRCRIDSGGFQILRERIFEANVLFDTADSTLYAAGKALRVRQRGTETILTFKGPAERDRHKVREEIETSADDAGALLAILAHLGFTPAYRYEKFRTEYARPGESGIATLDETPIGVFIELEGDGAWIDRTAAHLGFSERDYIIDSYLSLFRRYCEDKGREIGPGMIFGESLSQNLSESGAGNPKST